jgi:hypothetical protein
VVPFGIARIVAGGGEYTAIIEAVATSLTELRVRYLDSACRPASLSSSAPDTWAAGDSLNVHVAGLPIELV